MDPLLSSYNAKDYPDTIELSRRYRDAMRNSSRWPLMWATDLGLPTMDSVVHGKKRQCTNASDPSAW